MIGKRIAIGAGAVSLTVLVGAAFAFKTRIREEWCFWKLRSGDEAAVQEEAQELATLGSARSIHRLFGMILDGRPSGRAEPSTKVKKFMTYPLTGSPVGGRATHCKAMIELIMASLGGKDAMSYENSIEPYKYELLLVEGRDETHAAIRRILAIVDCIDQLLAKAGPDALPELSRIAAESNLPPLVRNLASIEMEKARQIQQLGDVSTDEWRVIEDIRSSKRISDTALEKAGATGSERTIPALLDLYVAVVNGPSLGGNRRANRLDGVLRAIIERRKEAVVPILVDCCLHALDDDIRPYAASRLREMGLLRRSAIQELEIAIQSGDELERRRAAEALKKITE